MHELLLELVVRTSAAFTRHGIPHALVGGIALAVHGYTRATTDIDLLIEPQSLPIARTALKELGLLQTEQPTLQFQRVEICRALVRGAEDLIVVDVLMVPKLGPTALSRTVTRTLDGIEIPIVSADDLAVLKLLRDSERDRLDVQELALVQTLDAAYILARARELGIEDRAERMLRDLQA